MYQRIEDRSCQTCGTALYARCSRDLSRKKFCSRKCAGVANGRANGTALQQRRQICCAKCGTSFLSEWPKAKYCSKKCQSASAAMMFNKRRETLEGHLHRLVGRQGRGELSIEFLLGLHSKQMGRCALSGVLMTWTVGDGRTHTNISIDRIEPKGKYVPGNVRLVCTVVNLMRRNMSDEVFYDWCETITYAMVPKLEVA